MGNCINSKKVKSQLCFYRSQLGRPDDFRNFRETYNTRHLRQNTGHGTRAENTRLLILGIYPHLVALLTIHIPDMTHTQGRQVFLFLIQTFNENGIFS